MIFIRWQCVKPYKDHLECFRAEKEKQTQAG